MIPFNKALFDEDAGNMELFHPWKIWRQRDITGSSVSVGFTTVSGSQILNFQSTCPQGAGAAYGYAVLNRVIDLTNVKKAKVDMQMMSNGQWIFFLMSSDAPVDTFSSIIKDTYPNYSPASQEYGKYVVMQEPLQSGGWNVRVTREVDLTEYSGKYYVGFFAGGYSQNSGTNTHSHQLYNITFE